MNANKLFLTLVLLGVFLTPAVLAQADAGNVSPVMTVVEPTNTGFFDGQTFLAELVDLGNGVWAFLITPLVGDEEVKTGQADATNVVAIPVAINASNVTESVNKTENATMTPGVVPEAIETAGAEPEATTREEQVFDATEYEPVAPVKATAKEAVVAEDQNETELTTLAIESASEADETPATEPSVSAVNDSVEENPVKLATKPVEESVVITENITVVKEPELPPYHEAPKQIQTNSPVNIVETGNGTKIAKLGSIGQNPSKKKMAVIGSIGQPASEKKVLVLGNLNRGGQPSQEVYANGNNIANSIMI